MSAMKNVAIAMEEVLMILETLPEAQQNYLVRELPEINARRQADELGIDVPSQYTAWEWMNIQRDPERLEAAKKVLGAQDDDSGFSRLWLEMNADHGPIADYWDGGK